jgi:hypothetical protein
LQEFARAETARRFGKTKRPQTWNSCCKPAISVSALLSLSTSSLLEATCSGGRTPPTEKVFWPWPWQLWQNHIHLVGSIQFFRLCRLCSIGRIVSLQQRMTRWPWSQHEGIGWNLAQTWVDCWLVFTRSLTNSFLNLLGVLRPVASAQPAKSFM